MIQTKIHGCAIKATAVRPAYKLAQEVGEYADKISEIDITETGQSVFAFGTLRNGKKFTFNASCGQIQIAINDKYVGVSWTGQTTKEIIELCLENK